MAPLEATRYATTWLRWDQVIDRLGLHGPQYRWTSTRTAPNRIDVRRGSQAALRRKGASFTSIDQFPVVACVQADPVADGTQVSLRCLDDLGVGTRLGMRRRYSAAVEDFADLVLAVCCPPAPTGAAPACPDGHLNAPGAVYCTTCAAPLVCG